MHYTKLAKLKELTLQLNSVAAEMISIFAESDYQEWQNEEELKKSPTIE